MIMIKAILEDSIATENGEVHMQCLVILALL